MDGFKKMRIATPVVCQNGHEAISIHEIAGLEYTYKGVPKDMSCDCPKWKIGEGWYASGSPYVMIDES